MLQNLYVHISTNISLSSHAKAIRHIWSIDLVHVILVWRREHYTVFRSVIVLFLLDNRVLLAHCLTVSQTLKQRFEFQMPRSILMFASGNCRCSAIHNSLPFNTKCQIPCVFYGLLIVHCSHDNLWHYFCRLSCIWNCVEFRWLTYQLYWSTT